MLADERLKLGDDLALPTEREVGVDPLLDRRESQLLERGDLALRKRLLRELGESGTTPQGQRLLEPRGPLGRAGRSNLLERPPEPVRVHARRLDRE